MDASPPGTDSGRVCAQLFGFVTVRPIVRPETGGPDLEAVRPGTVRVPAGARVAASRQHARRTAPTRAAGP